MFTAVGFSLGTQRGAAEHVDDAPLDVAAQRVAVDVGRKLDDHAIVARVDPERDHGGGAGRPGGR